ncbi:unnamed protein product [Phytophthora fragariaefolia]|uniref:Unnamed protein product n=1 Tax=Phytophthora fragariaefolia TaxID=1490495 RepID=A0A9W6XLA5_9STRA|nr:unnamed protein product [Phytophthora fragariaefolia]
MKPPRAAEDVSPNLRPRQQTRLDEEINMGDAHDARAAGSPEAAASNGGTIPPRRSSGSAAANTPSQATSQAAPAPDVTTQIMQMMRMQQQAMQAQQQQFQAFMHQQALFQREMFESQARANTQKQKPDPPKFNGKSSEDLELWLFHIEEYLSAYASERNSPDSRFVDMVVPFLGPEAMSWYREFKNTLGDSPRVWAVFKQQIRLRFRDSDYDYNLLSKLHSLRVSGTQQDYTSNFMLLLSQLSIELPETVKRWFISKTCELTPAATSLRISRIRYRKPSSTLSVSSTRRQQLAQPPTQRSHLSSVIVAGSQATLHQRVPIAGPLGCKKAVSSAGWRPAEQGPDSADHTMPANPATRASKPPGAAQSPALFVYSRDNPVFKRPKHGPYGFLEQMATIRSHSVSTFVDCGASFNAITPQLVEKLGLVVKYYIKPVSIRVGGGKELVIPRKVVTFKCHIPGCLPYVSRALVMEVPENKDVLLGMPWFTTMNP